MTSELKSPLPGGWKHTAVLLLLALPWASLQAQDLSVSTTPPIPALGSGEESDAAAPAQPWIPMLLAAQYNVIHQHLAPFGARYSGSQSLPAGGDDATSQTVGIYFGVLLPSHWNAYLDIERFVGAGVGNTTGLGSPSNGDVVRAGTGLPKDFYIARAYAEYLLPLGSITVSQTRAQDQLPGEVSAAALMLKVGKLSAADDFDMNRYANSTRTQFMTWSLINDGAWDYPADTRGYTGGLVLGYLQPAWSLKFGYYRMPQRANQEALEWPITRAYGEDLELDMGPGPSGTVIRLLAYRNVARMGSYQDAIDIAKVHGGIPDIVADDRDGREKYGYGVNVEQPLADDGDTGVFLRAGWNDGRTETFVFTEVDRALSFGTQISGVHWHREGDRLGVAVSLDGLSAEHQRYLELGGCGFELCDGALDYAREDVLEVYYSVQLGRYAALSPDFQLYDHPGYNADRGPARIYGLRLHLQY